MYKAITITLLAIWSITLNAQVELNKRYKVYLFNGDVLRGQLLNDEEYTYDDDFMVLKLLSDTIVSVSTSEIIDYTKFNAPFPKISNYKITDDLRNGTTFRKSGSYIIYYLGIVPKRVADDELLESGTTTTFTLINGYKFKEGIAIGLGCNFDIRDKAAFPVFIDVRKYFKRRPVTMFISADVGYGFSFSEFTGNDDQPQKGGRMVQGGAGISIATSTKANLLFEVGYRNQAYRPNRETPANFLYDWEHWIFQIGLIF